MNKIINIALLAIWFALGSFSQVLVAEEIPDPKELLKQAVQSRSRAEGIEWTVELLHGPDLDRLTLERAVRVISKGHTFLATTIAPKHKAGEQALVTNESVLVHRKGMSRPVPRSRRQKLTSRSYSDIASIDYAGDYDVVSMDEDHADGEEVWIIDLVASSKDVAYKNVRYWISKERKVGVKAEFFAVSGKKLKSAEMDYRELVNGEEQRRLFISEIRIRDHLIKRPDIAVVKFSDPIFRDISEDELKIQSLQHR